MNHDASPVVERRRLRLELRQARQHACLTQEEVAKEMDWSLSKVIRIETGAVGISRNDLAALLRFYEVKDPERVRDLLALGKAARQIPRWNMYRDILPSGYFQYIEQETSASIIRSFEALAVPDLLQTEDYATAIIRLYGVNLPTEKVSALVELRMKRQELLLDRPNPSLLFFVLDEAVIHRLIGTEDLRQAQLEKLLHMADKPEVTIEIVPFSVGLHRGMAENFTILEFDGSPDNDVMYFESARDSSFSHDETEEITVYRELFEDLRRASLGPKWSLRYLREIAHNIAQERKRGAIVEL